MKIRNAKLSKEAIQTLRRIPVGIFAPYELVMAPVYVYLPKNGKFVAVKFPLQHFSSKEIEKFRPYENFYLPEFVDQIAPFQRAGESVRSLLQLGEFHTLKTNRGPESVPVPVTQHELDDSVLQLIGPLWNSGAKIEPFFLCFLANEICLPFSPQTLTEAAEASMELFELALLRASVGVFLALHIGYSNMRSLTLLREKIFWDSMNGARPADSASEVSLLQQLLWAAIPDADTREISLESVRELLWRSGVGGKVSRKLLSRLQRVQMEFIRGDARIASLYGEKGICNE